ncbi:unnamed protein product, partial [Mesorhabditis belari]|uniref:Uncharacterized protein n=1 Tax=Mesorhabditis belari TaxID=2138241 RepID=A0AAF3FIM9_9BILA
MMTISGIGIILLLACFSFTNAAEGGSSISGMWVSCYEKMDDCLSRCDSFFRQCYVADHCNDGTHQQAACAPNVTSMVLLTFALIVGLLTCCCVACFCAPCCICYQVLKKRRTRERDTQLLETNLTTTKASAPPQI